MSRPITKTRQRHRFAALAIVGPTVFSLATTAAAEPVRAADLAASIGVNVHLEYTDSSYADAGRTLDDLAFLGVSLVRDAAPDPHNQGQASYGALAKAGVRFDLFVNGGDLATAVEGLAALQTRYPGAVHEIEGPNEINNHATFSFAGLTDKHRAAAAYQAALYERVKASPTLKRIPVLAFTDYPATPGPCDVANFHAYPDGRGAPGERLARDADDASAVAPGEPLVDTEFGYYTQPMRGALSERGQARLILTGLLDNAAHRVRETDLYQLLDAYPDPGARDSEKHYGLFDINHRPKASAKMLRRLVQLLQDAAPDAQSFALRSEGVAIKGLPPTARTLVIEKATGDTLIAIWDERPVWDAAKATDLEAPQIDLGVQTPAGQRLASLIDLVDGTAIDPAPASALHVRLGSSPIIVRVSAQGRDNAGLRPAPLK
jgi:hypothetical protein